MDVAEWTYAILLVISVGFGFVFKLMQDPNKKRLISTVVGLSMVAITCGWHILHSVITIAGTILLIRTTKQCHIWSFVWCFSYLLFFRTTHYFSLPKVPPVSNAVQLILTLKMVGLAFEIYDSRSLKKDLEEKPDNEDIKLRVKYVSINPSVFDIITYAYCYIGLLTGPYFKFRVYHDMLYMDSKNIDTTNKFLVKLRLGLICAVVFLGTSKLYWIEYAHSEEIYERSVLYRLWFMVPMFIWFRARMYAAWIISECVCITACLGAYPAASKPRCGKGPTDLKALEQSKSSSTTPEYDFETVHNISISGCELEPTLREPMRCWNMSVQYWLVTFVYKRVASRTFRTWITMAVSAFWHGIHPGYYLSFMTVPLCQLSEDVCAANLRVKLSSNGQKIYDLIRWFFRFRELDYMCMGFLLLRFDYTIRYWSSIYFIPHIVSVVALGIGLIAKKLTKTRTE